MPMKKHLAFNTSLAIFGSLIMIISPTTALAAKPSHGGGGSGGSTSAPTGNDISWPQCSKRLPQGQLFGIVGVNDGLANTTNPCFGVELSWANNSLGGTNQPKAALYVNTANPGDVTPTVADWPKSNTDVVTGATDTDPYGGCTGANSAACAWQYGYNMANLDVNERGVPSGAYTWYLDVETDNSWSSSTADNAADLEGMTAYFESAGGTVGLYSTSYQWGQVVGTPSTTSNLNSLISWLPGASSSTAAKNNCSLPSLTNGGKVTVTQYVAKQTDYDVSCI